MKGIIFDMDGTLVKENRYWEVARAVAFDLTGKELPFSFIQGCKNKGINSNWRICYEFVKDTVEVPYEKFYNICQKKLEEMNPQNELAIGNDSIMEVLTNLRANFSLFIATSRPRIEALEAVNSTVLSYLFSDKTVFGKEDATSNPIKISLLSLIKAKFPMGKYIVVGDTVSDIQAAKSLGFKSVGLYESLDNKKELESAGADYVIPSIAYLSIRMESE